MHICPGIVEEAFSIHFLVTARDLLCWSAFSFSAIIAFFFRASFVLVAFILHSMNDRMGYAKC